MNATKTKLSNMSNIVKQINSTPHKVFIAATGGGSSWVGDFLNCGGGSATLAGFYVPYAMEMTDDFIGGSPREGGYVSDSTARQLSVASYEKAIKTVNSPDLAVGIGITCSLAKVEKEREGRLNHGYISVQQWNKTYCIYFNFSNSPIGNSRYSQEEYLKMLITELVAYAFNLDVEMDTFKYLQKEKVIIKNEVWPNMDTDDNLELMVPFSFSNGMVTYETLDTSAIFPGSFNPIHDAHIEMAEIFEKETGKRPVFELSIVNFEKPKLDFKETITRFRKIKEAGYDVILTTCPTIREKADNISFADLFLMGVDTYNRISPDDIEYLNNKGVKLFVLSRDGVEIKPHDILHEKCLNISFDNPLRSTIIRNENTN